MLRFWKRHLRLAFILLGFSVGLFVFFVVGLPEATVSNAAPVPAGAAAGAEESCLACHGPIAGLAPAHSAIGCSPCHLGHPEEAGAEEAHRDMFSVPGNLADMHLTCGTANCHADIARRVENSLMASMAGVITVNRWAFGESDTLSAWAHVQDLQESSPADTHLRQLCASCHLGNQKEGAGPVGESSRGGGCIACHLAYSPEALAAHEQFLEAGRKGKLAAHPAISLKVGNAHCFGCHSRSGRISTNYEGWHETKLAADEVAGKAGYRVLADQRVFEFMQPDVHHVKGMECIDCHSAKELMGDGQRYFHEEQAVKTFCGDCHFSGRPPLAPLDSLDVESKKILALRRLPYQGAAFVVGRYSGGPLFNVLWKEGEGSYMLAKNSGRKHPLSPSAEVCTKGKAHDALTCSACHAGWAPQCVGCHTAYEPEATGFDLLDHKKVAGKWEEYLGEFFAEAPALGFVEEMDVDSQTVKRVKAFIPGMIMTIDQSAFPGQEAEQPDIFHRLFAPAAPHTTTTRGRSCQSCHNNPLALGYGRGTLRYDTQGKRGTWRFEPDYVASPRDGLPQDAWIGFLQTDNQRITNQRTTNTSLSTRPNARPFNIAEQRRILTVGACLTCHKADSKVMMEGLEDFNEVLKRVGGECVLPEW